jgi:hypothetical protein
MLTAETCGAITIYGEDTVRVWWKYAIGAEGIKRAIIGFLMNYPGFFGYMPFLIVQLRFPFNKEAKVSSYFYIIDMHF